MSKYNKGESQKTTPLKDQTLAEIIDELFEMGVLTGRGKANIDVAGAKRIATKHIRALITEEVEQAVMQRDREWIKTAEMVNNSQLKENK